MKINFKIIAVTVSILILVPVIVFFGPWIFLTAWLLFAPGDIVFTEYPDCTPEVVLVSTIQSQIYRFSSVYSQNYSRLEIGSNDHYISLNPASNIKDRATLLPEGTKLYLDGYVIHQEPTGTERGFSSEIYTFRGSIGEDTVWISDFELDDFQWETNDLRHKDNEASLISIGFIEEENTNRSRLRMPSDWHCLQQ